MTTPHADNGSTRWYYADANNQPVGPVSFAELNRLHMEDIITSTTQVLEEGGTEWKPYHTAYFSVRRAATPTALPHPPKKHSRLVVVLLLILFWPIGLLLMWRNAVFPRPVRLLLTGILGFAGIMMLAGMAAIGGGSSYRSGASSSYSAAESTPEPTASSKTADMPIEKQLAIVNANKAVLPSNDVTVARFRYLIERAVERTGDAPKAIADAACKGQGLVRENGKNVTVLEFMERVNKLLSAPGVPKMKYYDAALMTAIEASQ